MRKWCKDKKLRLSVVYNFGSYLRNTGAEKVVILKIKPYISYKN